MYELERTELKFAVPPMVAAEVFQCATVFLPPDRGVSQPQRITSLYLDGPDLQFLRWTKQKRANRFKLRVRAYGDQLPDIVFAEIKSRFAARVHKQRAEVP